MRRPEFLSSLYRVGKQEKPGLQRVFWLQTSIIVGRIEMFSCGLDATSYLLTLTLLRGTIHDDVRIGSLAASIQRSIKAYRGQEIPELLESARCQAAQAERGGGPELVNKHTLAYPTAWQIWARLVLTPVRLQSAWWNLPSNSAI